MTRPGRRELNPHGHDPGGDFDPHSEALTLVLEQHLRQSDEAALRAAQSVGGVLLRGARNVPIGTGPTGASASTGQVVTLATGALMGFVLGSPLSMVVTFRERTAEGEVLFQVNVTGGAASVPVWFGPGGVALTNGLYVTSTTNGGATHQWAGAVFLREGETP